MSIPSSNIRVITTIGQLELQEQTNIQAGKALQRGEIVLLKASKPTDAAPYGYAEVLNVGANNQYKIRRFD